MDDSNPWFAAKERFQSDWQPERADALFVGGTDWPAVPDQCTVPVINLIQGLGHADPNDPRYAFLQRHAMRICVSKEVEKAITATGCVNGPIFTIPAGLDRSLLPKPAAERNIPILIAGLKQPALAQKLDAELTRHGVESHCLKSAVPRVEFLHLLGRALVTVFLPHDNEGFYLPALEGMAMGTFVICPDCRGNREFCSDGINCLMPDYNPATLLAACLQALATPQSQRTGITAAGVRKAALHEITTERHRYLRALESFAAGDS